MTRVLKVHGEQETRVALWEFLREAGCGVEVLEDAKAARQWPHVGESGAAVSDIILPGISGVELLQAVRIAGDPQEPL